MQATIADIRRGDRFTRLGGRGGTYIAVRAAKPYNGGTYGLRTHVWIVEDKGQQIGADGIVDLGEDGGRMINDGPETPVEIHERGLPIHHIGDDPLAFTDTPNPHLGGKTDRELEAGRLRESIPTVIGQIDNLGSERDILIRKALAAGISAIELKELTGLSRARIYQIRDGRR